MNPMQPTRQLLSIARERQGSERSAAGKQGHRAMALPTEVDAESRAESRSPERTLLRSLRRAVMLRIA